MRAGSRGRRTGVRGAIRALSQVSAEAPLTVTARAAASLALAPAALRKRKHKGAAFPRFMVCAPLSDSLQNRIVTHGQCGQHVWIAGFAHLGVTPLLDGRAGLARAPRRGQSSRLPGLSYLWQCNGANYTYDSKILDIRRYHAFAHVCAPRRSCLAEFHLGSWNCICGLLWVGTGFWCLWISVDNMNRTAGRRTASGHALRARAAATLQAFVALARETCEAPPGGFPEEETGLLRADLLWSQLEDELTALHAGGLPQPMAGAGPSQVGAPPTSIKRSSWHAQV